MATEKRIQVDRRTFTLREAAALWIALKHEDWSAAFRSDTEAVLVNYILPQLGPLVFEKIGHSRMVGFHDWLAEQHTRQGRRISASRVKNIMQMLHSLCRTIAGRCGLRNPFHSVRRKPTGDPVAAPLAPEEFELILQSVDPRYRTYVLILGTTGVYAKELDELTWRFVDLSRGALLIRAEYEHRRGRGVPTVSPDRDVMLTPQAFEALLALHAAGTHGPDDRVFTTSSGYPVRPKHFRSQIWIPACKIAGVSGHRPRDLRHTAIVRMIEAGCDLPSIAYQVAHTSIEHLARVYGEYLPRVPDRLTAVEPRTAEVARAAGF